MVLFIPGSLDLPARLERKRLLRKPLGLQFALVSFAFFPTCTSNERKKIRENKELLRVFVDVTSFPLSHGDLQHFSAGLNCPMFSNCGDYNDPFWKLSRATLSLEKKYIHFSCYC